MIILSVEPYCKNCKEFEPECSKIDISTLDDENHVNTLITCEHRQRCKVIERYLSMNVEKTDYT